MNALLDSYIQQPQDWHEGLERALDIAIRPNIQFLIS